MRFLDKIKNIRSLKNFCKNKFKQKPSKNEKLVLIEFNSINECYVTYSYFISELSKKFNAKIFSFCDLRKKSLKNIFFYCLMKANPFSRYNIYKSFGVTNLIYFQKINKNLELRVQKKYKNLINNIRDKRKFEKIKIEGILVGDLLYDTYLKKTLKPTIDFEDNEFKLFLYNELIKFYFWYDFIDKNVKSIVVSHTVYSFSIPLRICLKKILKHFKLCR